MARVLSVVACVIVERAGVYFASMVADQIDGMKRYVAFEAADAARLRAVAPRIMPHLPQVVGRFYDALRADPEAVSVFTGGEAQIQAQYAKLLGWIHEVFTGTYDAAYFENHARVGRVHVEVRLPQRFMINGMEIIRQELIDLIVAENMPKSRETIRSLEKLLSIELAVMLEAYKEFYSAHIRSSEREVYEEKLTKTEHLAKIGQLAAALAHAIKNPLAGISGAIQVIRGGLPASNPNRPIIDEMLAQIHRLDSTVKDLLVYARPRNLAMTSVDLNELIARILNLLREEPTLRPLRVTFERDPALPRMEGDEHQLEQVVMNLLLNAADASVEGDRILIRTHFDHVIQMQIIDNGVGMSPEQIDRAFEPFHTTKTKGTGLGLSICKQIVEAHGGDIRLTSVEKHGTTVTVELPVSARRTTRPKAMESAA